MNARKQPCWRRSFTAAKRFTFPLGAAARADLVFEDDDRLNRVQVKSGVLGDRTVSFNTCSNTKNVPRDYRGQIDYFGVYCHELLAAFLVPIDDVPLRQGRLRVGPPRSNQQRNIRWAAQYRLNWSPAALAACEPTGQA